MAQHPGQPAKKSTAGRIFKALRGSAAGTKTYCPVCEKPVSGGTHHPKCGKRAHYVAPPRRDPQAQDAAFEQSLRRGESLDRRARELGL